MVRSFLCIRTQPSVENYSLNSISCWPKGKYEGFGSTVSRRASRCEPRAVYRTTDQYSSPYWIWIQQTSIFIFWIRWTLRPRSDTCRLKNCCVSSGESYRDIHVTKRDKYVRVRVVMRRLNNILLITTCVLSTVRVQWRYFYFLNNIRKSRPILIILSLSNSQKVVQS